mgnify:FL=1
MILIVLPIYVFLVIPVGILNLDKGNLEPLPEFAIIGFALILAGVFYGVAQQSLGVNPKSAPFTIGLISSLAFPVTYYVWTSILAERILPISGRALIEAALVTAALAAVWRFCFHRSNDQSAT